jgi:hypothetical protein
MWFVYERVHIYCQVKNDALSEAVYEVRLFLPLNPTATKENFCAAKFFKS